MLLSELLETIPSDTEERVRRTRDRLNQQIREILRQETGLRFRRSVPESTTPDLFGGSDPPRGPVYEPVTVRVQLVPGLPLALRQKQIAEKDRLAALIAPWRISLEHLRDSGKDVERLAPKLLWSNLGRGFVEPRLLHLQSVIELAEALLREATKFDLATWILEVNEDVLGAYFYRVPKGALKSAKRQDPWIELYWSVIGLLARLLGVEVEDLTVVVLTHELAHAYTHVGTDIDGEAWSAIDFNNSELTLQEGLAQYYAHVACQRLEIEAPHARKAFSLLLERQPAAYHSHEPWLKHLKPEEVRLAILQIRRSGPASLKDFDARLNEAVMSLRNRPGGQRSTP